MFIIIVITLCKVFPLNTFQTSGKYKIICLSQLVLQDKKVSLLPSLLHRLTLRLFWRSLITTFHPLVVAQTTLMWTWWLAVSVSLHLLRMVLNIPLYFYWLVLGYHVLRELLYIARLTFTGPRVCSLASNRIMFLSVHWKYHIV